MVRTATGKTEFECVECGWSTPKWAGRCGRCGGWDCLVECTMTSRGNRTRVPLSPGPGTSGGLRLVPGLGGQSGGPESIERIDATPVRAWPTGIGEFDRVLGGGIVPGSVILLAGEPGVGKSTLLLDVAARAARSGRRVLYATGEETASQVKLRAERIGALAPELYLVATGDLGELVTHMNEVGPELVFVDSVQTLSAEGVEGAPGGVAHVRGVTGELVAQAKARNTAAILVGHVTKEGAVAGPRTLEHLVDVVCCFDGESRTALRMLRASKNRYGSAEEVGCFELGEGGLREITDPSGLFVQAEDAAAPGCSIGLALEGRRPIAAEVQALVVPSALPSPRRTTSGVDGSRLAMVLAVLQRRAKIVLSNQDVYVSTVGGARVVEPALDLAIAVALAGARWDLPGIPGTAVIGEVGLGGEVRAVRGMARRLAEAARLGFTRAVVPDGTSAALARDVAGRSVAGLTLVEVPDVGAAVRAVM
ncbi:MAG: DNA repair protein RadA, partial [Bifidobacteriaceae bacterium]|nr:DNA repair protein RadA [Bifidobacteriaceae bacterium]